MKVSEIMSGRVVTIGQREPVIAAARLLKRMNLGALPVTDDKGKLKGMLTDRDIVLRCVAAGADPRTLEIGEIMTRGVVTAAPELEVSEAARLMRGDQVRRLPVVEGGKLVGMLSIADMARGGAGGYLVESAPGLAARKKVKKFCVTPFTKRESCANIISEIRIIIVLGGGDGGAEIQQKARSDI